MAMLYPKTPLPFYGLLVDDVAYMKRGEIVTVTKLHVFRNQVTGYDTDRSAAPTNIHPDTVEVLTLDKAIELVWAERQRIVELETQIENAATALGYNNQ